MTMIDWAKEARGGESLMLEALGQEARNLAKLCTEMDREGREIYKHDPSVLDVDLDRVKTLIDNLTTALVLARHYHNR